MQAALSRHAFAPAFSCTSVSEDQYGRAVATCSISGTDLGEWLVRNGLALDWPQYSKGTYAAAECRSCGPRHVGRQLRGAMPIPRVHQGGRHPDQLFG